MNMIQRIEGWGVSHHPRWMDIVRIALGIFLCYKGVLFAESINTIQNLMANNIPFSSFMLILLGHYIVFAHILGGFLLAMGMLTRFACLIQLPIVLGAIFINTSPVLRPFPEIFLSIIVFLLLVYFFISGGGHWAFDWYNEERKD